MNAPTICPCADKGDCHCWQKGYETAQKYAGHDIVEFLEKHGPAVLNMYAHRKAFGGGASAAWRDLMRRIERGEWRGREGVEGPHAAHRERRVAGPRRRGRTRSPGRRPGPTR